MRNRSVAFFLCLVFGISLLASCSRGTVKDAEILSADTPWYDSFRCSLEPHELIPEDNRLEIVGADLCGEKILVSYKFSDNETGGTRNLIDIYDDDLKFLKTIELKVSETDNQYYQLLKLFPGTDGTKAIVLIRHMDYINPFYEGFAEVDLNTGKITEFSKIKELDNSNVYMDSYTGAGKYIVLTVSIEVAGELTYALYFYEGTEFAGSYSSKEIIDWIQNIRYDKATDTVDFDVMMKGSWKKICFDVKTETAVNETDISSRSGGETITVLVNDSDYAYTSEGEELKVDVTGDIFKRAEDGSEEVLLSASFYQPYFKDLLSRENIILSRTDEKVLILSREKKLMTPDGISRQFLTVLKKADSNPHSGKKVIDLYAPNGMGTYLSSAIRAFNEGDNGAFIRIWNPPLSEGEVRKQDDEETILMLMSGQLDKIGTEGTEGDKKMLSILQSGDVPDLIIDADYLDVMNERFFEDLSDIVDDVPDDEIFKNITDASRFDDRLFCLPVSVSLSGLCTDEDISLDQKGVTIDEYAKIVKTAGNGIDCYSDRFDMICSCVDLRRSVKDGKLDLLNDDVRSICRYAKENIFVNTYDITTMDETVNKRSSVESFGISGFGSYVSNISRGTTVFGKPSAERYGISAAPGDSVSLTRDSEVKEEAVVFIRTLLDGSFELDEPDDGIWISRKALKDSLPMIGENLKKEVSYGKLQGMQPYELKAMALSVPEPGMDEDYLKLIDEVNNIDHSFSDISYNNILFEELLPYFADDRELDDALSIAQDRIQKILDERR